LLIAKATFKSDVDREEVEPEVELPENPQAHQRAQDARRGTRRANGQIGCGMDCVADDGAEHHRAEIDDEEVGRSDPPFEMSAPEHETQHVGRKVDEIDMQEAMGDQPPIFMPRQRGRIHATIAKQQFRRRR
jgi:hypothetical protein